MSSKDFFRATNPTTGEVLTEVPINSEAEVEASVARAAEMFPSWAASTMDHRAGLTTNVAAQLLARRDELSRLMALEMGKPVVEGLAEIDKCALACSHAARHAHEYLSQDERASNAKRSFVQYDPLGVTFGIMPWNFPFWQVIRFAASTLLAGNVVMVKHAPSVPGCAEVLKSIFLDSGVPLGVYTNIFVNHDVAERLIADRRIAAVSFTGSTRAGRRIASLAGHALKPSVLELGGSDAFLVFDDCDVRMAAAIAAASRCINSGQSCVAAKRFIVQKSVHDEFVKLLCEEMVSRPVGNPLLPDTRIGPLARRDLLNALRAQVEASIAVGARVAAQGTAPGGEGNFHPATVLIDVPHNSPVACEEVFGPVASVFSFDSESEAIRLTNATSYGLGASIWTKDVTRIGRMAREIKAGAVFFNQLVKSDPSLPFGGVGDSGWGRELGAEGMRQFTNAKTVWIE